MQRTIIALWGISRLGKTTTIHLAFDDLRKEATNHLNLCPRRSTEVVAILEIDGVKVGFASLGDTPGVVEEYLDVLIENGCVVIVCAVCCAFFLACALRRLA